MRGPPDAGNGEIRFTRAACNVTWNDTRNTLALKKALLLGAKGKQVQTRCVPTLATPAVPSAPAALAESRASEAPSRFGYMCCGQVLCGQL